MTIILTMILTAIISCVFFCMGYQFGKRQKPKKNTKAKSKKELTELEQERIKQQKTRESFQKLMNYTEEVAVRGRKE